MKKKVLFIVGHPKFSIGGAEIQSLKIAKELIKQGDEVRYLMPSSKPNKKAAYDENGIQINQYRSFKYFRIFEMITFLFALINIKSDVYYIRARNIVEGVAVAYSKFSKKNIKVIWQCASGRSLIKYYNLKKYKNVFFINYIYNVINYLLIDVLRSFSIRNSDNIILQSEDAKEVLKNRYFRKGIVIKKGTKIPVDNNYEKSEVLSIVYLRNFKKNSRPELFLELVKELKTRDIAKKMEFIMIGRVGTGYDKLINEAKEIGIKILGELPNNEVINVLKSSHVLIDTLYEVNNLTTYSNSFIEAWVNYLIVVSFSSNPDNVLEEYNIGYKVENINQCADILQSLNNDEDKLKLMAKNAFNYVSNNHAIEDEIYKLKKIIAE